jgi:hypothetical protein
MEISRRFGTVSLLNQITLTNEAQGGDVELNWVTLHKQAGEDELKKIPIGLNPAGGSTH